MCSRVVIFFVRHGGFTDGRTDDFPVTRSRGRASASCSVRRRAGATARRESHSPRGDTRAFASLPTRPRFPATASRAASFSTFGHIHGPFCRAPPVKKIFCARRRHLSSARRRRRKIWRAKRWGHFCMEKVECPRTSAVPPPAVLLPHVTYRCPTQVHMWPPIERRAYVPSRPSTQIPFTVLLKAWIRIVRYLDIRVTSSIWSYLLTTR